MAQKRGYKTVKVQLATSELALRGSSKLVNAVQTITADMKLYEGVKFAQILEAVYAQGRKDGARAAFDSMADGLEEARKAVPHKNPGRPPKHR
jgi:hypothetical protein